MDRKCIADLQERRQGNNPEIYTCVTSKCGLQATEEGIQEKDRTFWMVGTIVHGNMCS